MAVGIIVEWNPFHNGHKHHIDEVKKMFPGEKIIAAMSGEFVQRGEYAVLSFDDRIEIAKQFGVDEVFEIPQDAVLQSAKYFAQGALKVLAQHDVDKIVFGSESDNIDQLFELADIESNIDFKKTLKKFMKQGNSYKIAYQLTTKEIAGKEIDLPNDILGFEYIKGIKELGLNIKPYTIKRTNDYHSLETNGNIISATAIRELLVNKSDVSKFVPYDIYKYNLRLDNDDLFKRLKQIFDTETLEQISQYKLVDEGIEFRFKKLINEAGSYDEFVNLANSKRYSSSRIKRTIANIVLKNKK